MRRFLLRLPDDLHSRLKRAAADDGMSMNEYCLARLAGARSDVHTHDRDTRRRALAIDHLNRAVARLAMVDALSSSGSWADVVRESQEVVELALTGLLRSCGVDPPRVHDVADVLIAERHRLPAALHPHVDALAAASRELRRDRELAFYGTDDLTPSDFYRQPDAQVARDLARQAVELVRPHVPAA